MAAAGRASLWSYGLLVLAASLALCWPFWRHFPWVGDEGILLRAAQEMIRGGRLYIDLFEIHPPAGFLIVQAWLAAFGDTVLSIRALAIGTITAVACLAYVVAVRASDRPALSAAIVVAWLVATQGPNTEVNHHYFTTLFTLAAMLASLEGARGGTSRWALAAGVTAGLAALTTPTRGALAMLASAVSLGRRPSLWPAFIVGAAVGPGVVGAYLLANGSLWAAWRNAIVWPALHYSGIQGVPFGSFADLQTVPIIALYPTLGLLALGVLAVRRRMEPELAVALAFAAAGLLGAYPRPDAKHLAYGAPVALPLAAYLLARVTEWLPRRYNLALAALAICALAPSAAAYGLYALRVAGRPVTETAAGPIQALGAAEGEMIARVSRLPTGEGVFYYPYMPLVPVLTRRPHMGTVDVLVPGYTTAEQYREACREMFSRALWVVYDPRITDAGFLQRYFPTMPVSALEPTREFERRLKAGYATVASFGSYELMRRTPEPARCP